ncbi:hypothetical protein Pcinc_034979 [Petrolisthes cinctipes]|uniref:Uncharacterized protein n=1 Tax=Petrolisthes cinctipes TaxID=88211 RepID=A0AAE1C0N1_PETCI|nr:hypothetical protein Pcinc_034979 [Petrolisthes cinctipes]
MNFNLSGNISKHFFMEVTNNVVLAVVENEEGDEKVESVLAMVTSHSVIKLSQLLSVKLLYQSPIQAQEMEFIPSIVELLKNEAQVVVEIYSNTMDVHNGGHLYPYVYAAINMGREGWCFFTSNFHTLVHVLHNNNIATDTIIRNHKCNANCGSSADGNDDNLRGYIIKCKINCGEHCHNRHGDTLLPRVRARQRNPLVLPFIIRQHLHHENHFRIPGLLTQEDSEGLRKLNYKIRYYYLAENSPESGWFLVAGFDYYTRKHLVMGRSSASGSKIEVERDEQEVREFLFCVRSLLRKVKENIVNEFLRNFTHANPIQWNDAVGILQSELSLQELAYQCVCQNLPLSYVRHHAPPLFYTSIRRTHTLPWAQMPWTLKHPNNSPPPGRPYHKRPRPHYGTD